MEKQTPNSFLAEKEAQEAFFRADTDGGGHIDIHELSTLLHGLLSDQIEAKAVSAGSPALRGLHICNGGDSGGMVEQCVLEALSMITPPCTCACCRAIARRPTSAGSCGTNFDPQTPTRWAQLPLCQPHPPHLAVTQDLLPHPTPHVHLALSRHIGCLVLL